MAPVPEGNVIVARRVGGFEGLGATEPIALSGWDGKPAAEESLVRVGTDGRRLLVEFACQYAELHVDSGARRAAPTPRLWERDVVEVFVSDRAEGAPYREIEASPLGQWLALAFDGPRVPARGEWTFRPEVEVIVEESRFRVRLRLEIEALRTGRGNAKEDWRIGLFRISGREPARRYDSLAPTLTAQPDFHRPERWARLRLAVDTAAQ